MSRQAGWARRDPKTRGRKHREVRCARGERRVSELLVAGRARCGSVRFPDGCPALSPTTFCLAYQRGQPWAPVVDAPAAEPPGDGGLGRRWLRAARAGSGEGGGTVGES